jgi:calcineurin-like phosphoesterase family protein
MIINKSDKIWFTSDTHWGHNRIIELCHRPFSSLEEMDKALIDNWNSVVKENDTVFHLGDFAWGSVEQWETIISQLKGQIVLIKGNHDKHKDHKIAHLFDGVYEYLKIEVEDRDTTMKDGKQEIVLFHYSIRDWDKKFKGSWNLYGHSHANLPDVPAALAFDIGVDCHSYTPISYDRVKEIMKEKLMKDSWKLYLTPEEHERIMADLIKISPGVTMDSKNTSQ